MDDAFATLLKGAVEALIAGISTLSHIRLDQAMEGTVPVAEEVGLDQAMKLNGQYVGVSVEDDKVMGDSAEVIIRNIETSNDAIYVIDAILIPAARSDCRSAIFFSKLRAE